MGNRRNLTMQIRHLKLRAVHTAEIAESIIRHRAYPWKSIGVFETAGGQKIGAGHIIAQAINRWPAGCPLRAMSSRRPQHHASAEAL